MEPFKYIKIKNQYQLVDWYAIEK